MERGKMLLPLKIEKILKLRKENRCVAEVARAIGGRRKVVMNFIADPQSYGERKPPGRPRAITSRRKAKNFEKGL